MANEDGVTYTVKELLNQVNDSVQEVRKAVERIEERVAKGHDDHERRISANEFRITAIERAENDRDAAITSLRNTFIGLAVSVAVAAVVFGLSILAATGKL